LKAQTQESFTDHVSSRFPLTCLSSVASFSFATDETERNFVSIIPPIIIDAVQKLSQFLGDVSGVTAHYQKALVTLFPFGNVIVLISFQAGVKTPFYERIAEAVKKLGAQHLT